MEQSGEKKRKTVRERQKVEDWSGPPRCQLVVDNHVILVGKHINSKMNNQTLTITPCSKPHANLLPSLAQKMNNRHLKTFSHIS